MVSVLLSAFPKSFKQPVGALNIYSRTAGSFMPQDQELAAVFATEASVILTSAGVPVTKLTPAAVIMRAQT